ncbi:MAG: calcium-binding protein [Coleofasciculus sp. G3-WIS-01]|uniref:calcium-binding protein n=1 Tax=Coleofasciculus sp. G3-WIS-01 TaxID=3069528 RepID=UPI0033038C64
MTSDTLFLQPIDSTLNPNPLFGNATGSGVFFNYSQTATRGLTSAETETLVKGGVAMAIAQAEATFITDPTFTTLFTNSFAVANDGAFQVNSNSETQVIASFAVDAHQLFSFDFVADLAVLAKEVENPDTEYVKAQSQSTFLVLDTSDINNPKLIDYFGLQGTLISSDEVSNANKGLSNIVNKNLTHVLNNLGKKSMSARIGQVGFGMSRYLNIIDADKTIDTYGNNETDSVTGTVLGTYQRTFQQDIHLSIVQVNRSAVQLTGDTLIGNLGDDVIYGTIWADSLQGTHRSDNMYGSLGDDTLKGKNGDDLLEGGQGDDWLEGDFGDDTLVGSFGDDTLVGDWGDDILIGGSGNDTLIGGLGSNVLTGGEGLDHFVFHWQKKGFGKNWKSSYDVIKDFEVGIDAIKFQNWHKLNNKLDVRHWFTQMVSTGKITDTDNGTLLKWHDQTQIILEGVNVAQLSASDFVFT